MDLVEIYVFHLKTIETGPDSVHDVSPRSATVVGLRADFVVDLGRKYHVRALQPQIPDGLPGNLFGGTVPISIRRINEVDASLDSAREQLVRVFLAHFSHYGPETARAKRHRSEAK